MCENEQKRAKNSIQFLFFLPMIVNIILWSDNKRLKKVVMLFLASSKRYYVVGVHTSPKGRVICH